MIFSRPELLRRAGAVIVWIFFAGISNAQTVSNTETSWSVTCLSERVCELKKEIIQADHVAARVSLFNIRGYFWLQYTIPPGIDIGQGVSIAIDGEEPAKTIISNCTVYGCTGRLDISPQTIEKMKRGQLLKIFFVSPSIQETFIISFSLSGFTKGFKILTK